LLDEEVTQILFEGRRAVGACTHSGEYRADSLVINADFANAMAHLVPNELRNKWSDKNLKKKRYSCSTFMMYLGVDGTFDDVAHHNLYIPDDYAKNVREIQDEHVLSDQPSFYVQNACVTDKTLAPKNKSALYVLVPTTHETGSVDWNRETARYRRLVLDQLPKVGLHDVERRIRFERIVTPADWARDHAVYKGAVFNLAHNLSQMLARRPQNHFSELESVYLTGGGTHPGSGLFTIFESAKISSRLLLEHRGMSSAYIDQEAPQLPARPAIPALPARRVA
jgi:phytoene desaturase